MADVDPSAAFLIPAVALLTGTGSRSLKPTRSMLVGGVPGPSSVRGRSCPLRLLRSEEALILPSPLTSPVEGGVSGTSSVLGRTCPLRLWLPETGLIVEADAGRLLGRPVGTTPRLDESSVAGCCRVPEGMDTSALRFLELNPA